MVVSTRSTTYSVRYSSSMMPDSSLAMWFRLNPVAIRCWMVARGNRSPANCSMVNWS